VARNDCVWNDERQTSNGIGWLALGNWQQWHEANQQQQLHRSDQAIATVVNSKCERPQLAGLNVTWEAVCAIRMVGLSQRKQGGKE
jgi:hypothetical protein